MYKTHLSYANKMYALPEKLRRSLTYDRGKELTYHPIFYNLMVLRSIFMVLKACDIEVQIKISTNEAIFS